MGNLERLFEAHQNEMRYMVQSAAQAFHLDANRVKEFSVGLSKGYAFTVMAGEHSVTFSLSLSDEARSGEAPPDTMANLTLSVHSSVGTWHHVQNDEFPSNESYDLSNETAFDKKLEFLWQNLPHAVFRMKGWSSELASMSTNNEEAALLHFKEKLRKTIMEIAEPFEANVREVGYDSASGYFFELASDRGPVFVEAVVTGQLPHSELSTLLKVEAVEGSGEETTHSTSTYNELSEETYMLVRQVVDQIGNFIVPPVGHRP